MEVVPLDTLLTLKDDTLLQVLESPPLAEKHVELFSDREDLSTFKSMDKVASETSHALSLQRVESKRGLFLSVTSLGLLLRHVGFQEAEGLGYESSEEDASSHISKPSPLLSIRGPY